MKRAEQGKWGKRDVVGREKTDGEKEKQGGKG